MLGLYLNAILLGGLAYFLKCPEPTKAKHSQDEFHEVVGRNYWQQHSWARHGQYPGHDRSPDKGPAKAYATDPADERPPARDKDRGTASLYLVDFKLRRVRLLELGEDQSLLTFPLHRVRKSTLQ